MHEYRHIFDCFDRDDISETELEDLINFTSETQNPIKKANITALKIFIQTYFIEFDNMRIVSMQKNNVSKLEMLLWFLVFGWMPSDFDVFEQTQTQSRKSLPFMRRTRSSINPKTTRELKRKFSI